MTELFRSDYRRHCAEELMGWQIISVNFTNAWWLFYGVAEHVLFSKEKRPGREFYHLLPFSAKSKAVWSRTSVPLRHTLMTLPLITLHFALT